MSFFDMLGMFDPGDGPRGPRRDSGATDDDPVIVDVQADGDDHGETPSAGKGEPPKRGVPRLTPRPLPNGPSKGTKILIGVVLALVVVVGLFFGLSQFITDLMWYGQLGFQNVVWTQLGVKFGLWAAYALLMALVSYVSAWLAIRARPDSSDGSTFRIKDDVIEVGKSFSSKTARRAAVVVSLVVGVMFGSQFNSNWSEILLMFNAQSFGTADPQFGIDNGFYVFVLPGLRLVMSAVSMLLLMGIVFSVVTHAMMGGIRFTMPVHGRGVLAVTKRARRQIGIWLILNMLAWSARQVIGVFTHLTQQGDRITGAAYTTVHATIPVTFIMAAITAMLGVFLGVWLMHSHALEGAAKPSVRAAAALKAWRTPVIAIAAALVVSLVLTVAWPMLLQRFKVNPNAQEMESTYIQRNINATQQAYGLDKVKVEQYKATTKGKSGALSSEAESTAQIRLLDPQVVSPTFKQLQQSKRHAGRRQVRHRRRQPGHGDRRPRTGSGRQRQPQLGQRPHRVYAWVRCRGRIRQQGGGGRAAAVLRIQHPHPGQAHRIAEVRAAHLLLPERPRILDCRGSEGHEFVGVRLSDRIAGRDQYV